MRFLALSPFAVTLAAALPTVHQPTTLSDLTTSDFSLVQSIVGGGLFNPALAAEKIFNTFNGQNNVADDKEKTIWQLLNEDKDKFSKIIKLIEIEGGKAREFLDNRDVEVTFFAPENSGIPDPHHHDDDGDDDEDSFMAKVSELRANPSIADLYSFYTRYETTHFSSSSPDDKEKERRKEIFRAILGAVLQYHQIRKPYTGKELANNSTWPTALNGPVGASDGQPLRVRVEGTLLPPTLKLNFYSKITQADKQAKNGYFHAIDHPLIPPPSLLQEAFYFPDKFSTLTSAIQKVHGQKYVEWELDVAKSKKEHKAIFYGSPALTLFAPTNAAFAALPDKLRFFLFSPFGEHVLAKILSFHVLPEQILFLEHFHKVKAGKKDLVQETLAVVDDNGSFHYEVNLPTGLNKTEIKIVGDKSRVVPLPGAYKQSLTVNGVEVSTIDVPAFNGVGHEIGEVLKPPHKHHDHELGVMVESQWADWEHWLVDWAEQA